MIRPPKPRKVPKQGRSRETVRAIREACGMLLRESGYASLTTQRIADVAGVNIASLYQYFPNKDAILADFLEEEASQVAERTADLFGLIDRLSRNSLEHTLAAIVELELDQRSALVRLDPEFFERYPEGVDIHSKVNTLTRSRDNPEWISWLPEFLANHQPRLRSANVGLLATICHGALAGVTARSDISKGDRALTNAKVEVLFLLLSYLLASPPTQVDCSRYLSELDSEIARAATTAP